MHRVVNDALLFGLALFGLTLSGLVLPRHLSAQVDPRGQVQTIRTEHFRVHFAREHEPLARRAAAYAELAWSQLAAELAEPAVPVELLVADNVDFSNGFATPFPSNRIVVYALPSLFIPELRHYDDWLQLVITHELVHIFHLDRARGLWRLGRNVFGRNPALFPNGYLPRWMVEGLAVHYETKLTGSGRLASTEFPMIARTATLADDLPPPNEWSLTTSRFPLGQHAYGYGAMLMSQLAQRDSLGMRKFIDGVASHPIPYRVNYSVKQAFGVSVQEAWQQFRDSLQRAVPDVAAWSQQDRRSVARDMEWFAAQPRWESDSTLIVAMNDGRDVSGVYRAHVRSDSISLERIARRNSLDANALDVNARDARALDADANDARAPAANPPGERGELVFGQLDYEDPYVLRNALFTRDASGRERALPNTTRLFLPDMRGTDGLIIAVRVQPGYTELVRVQREANLETTVTTFAAGSIDTAFTEPRWSPDGSHVVAVRVIRGGLQEIVLLDSTGSVRSVVSSARGISSVPTFTPDGTRIIWASDRLGSMQLFSAAISSCNTACEVRLLTRVATGISSPTISPTGTHVAALEYTLNGSRLAVLPLTEGSALEASVNPNLARGTGQLAQRTPHVAPYADTSRSLAVEPDTSVATPYRPLRQLLPRWWMPIIGEGSDGAATFGLSSSGVDILRRHAWVAQTMYHPSRAEFEGSAGYRYSRLPRTFGWQPVFDASGSQTWDRFDVFDTTSTRIGELQRVQRLYSAGMSFSRPRVRNSASLTLGAQLETRDYATTPDSLLRRLESRIINGTQSPGVYAALSYSNVMRAGRAISLEDGIGASLTLQQRWKSGALQQTSRRAIGALRAYKALDFAGFARHALAARVSGGVTDQYATSELSVGGTSGSLAELIPGVVVGDPSRQFPVRGFVPGIQRGSRAVSLSAEYRAPLSLLARGVGMLPIFVDRISMSAFADGGRAWCSDAVRSAPTSGAICLPPEVRDGWLASVGTELALDLGVQWDFPYRARLGVAKPVRRPSDVSGTPTLYFTLGSSF